MKKINFNDVANLFESTSDKMDEIVKKYNQETGNDLTFLMLLTDEDTNISYTMAGRPVAIAHCAGEVIGMELCEADKEMFGVESLDARLGFVEPRYAECVSKVFSAAVVNSYVESALDALDEMDKQKEISE